MFKKNNEWLRKIKGNEIESKTKYINHNMIALNVLMIYNLKKALMILSDSWTNNQRKHKFNDSITIQRFWTLRVNLSHFAILSMNIQFAHSFANKKWYLNVVECAHDNIL